MSAAFIGLDLAKSVFQVHAETACMLFWALLASGQITLRRVDGWDTLHVAPADEPLDLAA